jgi:hypothetical protein
LDEIDFFEEVVDIPNGIPFAMKGVSFISLMESLCNDKLLSCCPNLEGDKSIDLRLNWLPFSTLFSLLELVAQSSLKLKFWLVLPFDVAVVLMTAIAQTSKASRAPS